VGYGAARLTHPTALGLCCTHAPAPVLFDRRRVRRELQFRSPAEKVRGAERRETRRSAKPPGRPAKPPETPCEGVSFSLAIGRRRLPALHVRLFSAPGRASRGLCSSSPRSASSWQEVLVPPGGAPKPPEREVTSLARGCRVPLRPSVRPPEGRPHRAGYAEHSPAFDPVSTGGRKIVSRRASAS
jgi:hypothetical protein